MKTEIGIEMRDTCHYLMALIIGMLTLALLLVICFETSIIVPGFWAVDMPQIAFGVMFFMELLMVTTLPLALRLFKFAAVHRQLVNKKSVALRSWGSVRLLMLGGPLVVNTFLYYAFIDNTYGIMALIYLLALPFVWPSMNRCLAETEDDMTDEEEPQQ